jgi:hypothetical protein
MCNHYNDIPHGGFHVCAECGEVKERILVPGIYASAENNEYSESDYESSYQKQFVAILHDTCFNPVQSNAANRILYSRLSKNERLYACSHLFHAVSILKRVCKKFEFGIPLTEECVNRFKHIVNEHKILNKTVFGAAVLYDTIKSHEILIPMSEVVKAYQEHLVRIDSHLLYRKLSEYPQFFSVKKANLGKMVSTNIDRVLDYCRTIKRIEKKTMNSRRNTPISYDVLRVLANKVALKLVPLLDGKVGCRPSLLSAAITYACFVISQNYIGVPKLITNKIIADALRMDEFSIRDVWGAYLVKYVPKRSPFMPDQFLASYMFSIQPTIVH